MSMSIAAASCSIVYASRSACCIAPLLTVSTDGSTCGTLCLLVCRSSFSVLFCYPAFWCVCYNCFTPAFFFSCSISSSLLERAFFNGRHLSGFFLFLLVPHSPFIEPSVPILTHFSSRHFLSSPISMRTSFSFPSRSSGCTSSFLQSYVRMSRLELYPQRCMGILSFFL